MLPAAQLIPVLLGQTDSGAHGWSQFVKSCGRALAENQAVAPIVGLVLLMTAVVVLDWKFAGWLERVLRGRSGRRARGTPTKPAPTTPRRLPSHR